MPPRKPQRSMSFAVPEDFEGDITRAAFPRQLILYDEKSNTWSPTTDVDVLASIEYMAVSYRQTDFPNRAELERDIQITCQIQNLQAYWLDYACTGATQAEKNVDLYRIADVFRGAKLTLIMIKGNDDRPLSDGWMSYGDRIWTLPEALLSPQLIYKVGSRFFKPINLRRLANVSYRDREEEMMLVDGYSGKDPLPLTERVELLRRAIWKRSSGPDKKVTVPGASTNTGGVFTSFRGERVYALMGFMQYRIMPNPHESEEEAFNRLMEANKIENHKFSWDVEQPRALSPEPQESNQTNPNAQKDPSKNNNAKGQFDPDSSPSNGSTDLDDEIKQRRAEAKKLSDDDSEKPRALCRLGISLGKKFDITGKAEDIDEAIEAENEAVRLTPDGHTNKARYCANLAISYKNRYNKFEKAEDLNSSIEHRIAAIRLASDSDPDKADYYFRLVDALEIRGQLTANPTDLDDAVAYEREAVRLAPDDRINKALYTHKLGLLLQDRFETEGEVEDLTEAIEKKREAVALLRDDDDSKAYYLISLAWSLKSHYDKEKDRDTLDQIIEVIRDGVRVVKDSNSEKPEYIRKLAIYLEKRYDLTGNMEDLDGMVANEEAAARAAPKEKKSYYYRIVAISYKNRYNQFKKLEDLNKSIEKRELAVEFAKDSDPEKAEDCDRLGILIDDRHDISHDIRDVELAIKYGEMALKVVPERSSEKARYRSNLGIYYMNHYNEKEDMPSLDKAILHRREAVRLSKDDASNKPDYLSRLGNSTMKRFEKKERNADIDTAVESYRDAVRVAEKLGGDKDSIKRYREKLVDALETRYKHMEKTADKHEAEEVRRALQA